MNNNFYIQAKQDLEDNYAVVYVNTSDSPQESIVGWTVKNLSGDPIFYYDTLHSIDLKYCTKYKQELTKKTICAFCDKKYFCKSRSELVRYIKDNIKASTDRMMNNAETKKQTIETYGKILGEYYELYSGCEAILIAVSTTDEDYYNVFLTETGKIVFSSAVGTPQQITTPNKKLAHIVNKSNFKDIVRDHIERINNDPERPDYIFLSILD